jgi:hypothetical protein
MTAGAPERKPRKLTLELAAERITIAGRVSDERGTSIEFSGWVGLASALERALAPAAPADAEKMSSHSSCARE